MLHRIYLNDTLYRWGLKASQTCDYCTTKQMIKHLFWECGAIQHIKVKMEEIYGVVEYENWFMGILPQNKTFGYVATMAKFYIYRCKCSGNKPTKIGLKNLIQNVKEAEAYNAKLYNNWKKYEKIWSQIDNLLNVL